MITSKTLLRPAISWGDTWHCAWGGGVPLKIPHDESTFLPQKHDLNELVDGPKVWAMARI